jgi:hypothetical protein
MKIKLLILLVLIYGINNGCKRFHNENARNIVDPIGKIESRADSLDSILKIEIKEANKKFEINDLQAIEILRQVRELREIIDWKYKNDSSIYNVAKIDKTPNDTLPNWTINIRQVQPKINHSTSLMFLIVNANNGIIKIYDIPKDTLLTIEEWKKMKGK